MDGPHHLPSRARMLWRRTAAAALLALQMLLVLSPLLERPPTERATAHTHDQQTRHQFAHDESNCGLCAARAQFADIPAAPDLVATLTTSKKIAVADRAAAPARAPRPAHPPRAPPTLS